MFRFNRSYQYAGRRPALVLRGPPGNPGRDGIPGNPGRDGRDVLKGERGIFMIQHLQANTNNS